MEGRPPWVRGLMAFCVAVGMAVMGLIATSPGRDAGPRAAGTAVATLRAELAPAGPAPVAAAAHAAPSRALITAASQESTRVRDTETDVLASWVAPPSCPPVPPELAAAAERWSLDLPAHPEAGAWVPPEMWVPPTTFRGVKVQRSPASDELPPKIYPSLYAKTHGEELFQKKNLPVWRLHSIPSDSWFDVARDIVDRCDLQQPWVGEEGLEHDITWVTMLLDLKRGESGNGAFRRSMDEYYARFQRVIDRGFKMVIFMPASFDSHLRLDPAKHLVIHFTVDDLERYFPYYERLTKVRTSDVWNRQAKETGWLSDAPQARLPHYDPLVMSKVNLMRDAARLNPFHTKYLMWMDAGHACAGELRPQHMDLYERHMEKFLITHWPYGTTTEVHGMLDAAMHLYVGTTQDPLRIVRGGILGGQRPYIECVAKVYNVVLAQTLTDGYLGTEENILAILFARFPELFIGFDNNSRGGHGDNCASFAANVEEDRNKMRGVRKTGAA